MAADHYKQTIGKNERIEEEAKSLQRKLEQLKAASSGKEQKKQ